MTDIRDIIVPGLVSGLRDVIEGAAEDLQAFAVEIASDLAQAASEGRDELSAELVAQARMVAEMNRLRIQDHAWGAFRAVLSAVVGAAVQVLTAGLLGAAARLQPPQEG